VSKTLKSNHTEINSLLSKNMNKKQFITFSSPAKLNLFLHINERRADNYHELQTLFQFLDHSDTIAFNVDDSDKIELLTEFSGVNSEDNLIIKAAQLLRKEALKSDFSKPYGAEIKIDKILPMGGGLGGGSSNAATTLLALNYLWKINFSIDKLADLGLTLGADVPVFIRGFSAFAQGVGELLTPAKPKEYWYLVTKPNCSISTAEIFNAPTLTRNTAKLALTEIDFKLCHNDCQSIASKLYPEVAKLLAWLVEYAPSQMTGTGACLFSRFDTQAEALLLQNILPKGIYSFVAKGLNQSPLVEQIAVLKNK